MGKRTAPGLVSGGGEAKALARVALPVDEVEAWDEKKPRVAPDATQSRKAVVKIVSATNPEVAPLEKLNKENET